MISIDTLRADRLVHAGYDRATSPNISRLAGEGIVFQNAYSPSGWTTPSMASLMTGLDPQDHGATRFDTPISQMVFTLAEILGGENYTSRAYVANSLVGRIYRFHSGFTEFDASILKLGHPANRETSAGLSQRVIDDLDGLSEPFFVWVHYMDPHRDYLPHAGIDFGDTESDLYDGEIAHTDAMIGKVLSALEERGLLDRTLVVLTADHGEELGERGGIGHFTLHEEVVRVPLIIRSPAHQPSRVETLISHADVLPTLFGILGLEPKSSWKGKDVLSDPDAERPLFFERRVPDEFRQLAIRRGRYKMIYIEDNPGPRSEINADYDELAKVETGVWLFDLKEDPGEKHNILSARKQVAAELFAMLNARFGEIKPPQDTITITPEHEEELRSLGYIP